MNIDFEKIFGKKKVDIDKICKAIKVNPDILKEFENSYKFASIDNTKRTNNSGFNGTEINNRIVDELVSLTSKWIYDDKNYSVSDCLSLPNDTVTMEDLSSIPLDIRPQLTGTLMKVDINSNSGMDLLETLYNSLVSKDKSKKQSYYNRFRQGLDLLDLDSITYALINQNKDSMGYWLPKIASSVDNEGFFKIPKTSIIKVPIPLLQLTRIGYDEINRTSLDITNEYCKRVFDLNSNNKYFIKTGTYSSKYDFRNTLVEGDEVNSLGEYLLYIHSQALSMAHFDIYNLKKPIIYGVSTTTEWVVRDFIDDAENNLTIYHGLPLHTEYRVFVDFDTKKVLGVHSYWDKDLLTKSFNDRINHEIEFMNKININDPNYENIKNQSYQSLIDAKHDLITYLGNYEDLNDRYIKNKDMVCSHIDNIIQDCDLTGQWSIDVMQNGDDFYIIDMHGASHSTFYKETVSIEDRKVDNECWIPNFDKKIEFNNTLQKIKKKC